MTLPSAAGAPWRGKTRIFKLSLHLIIKLSLAASESRLSPGPSSHEPESDSEAQWPRLGDGAASRGYAIKFEV